jgi:hypothetical protein
MPAAVSCDKCGAELAQYATSRGAVLLLRAKTLFAEATRWSATGAAQLDHGEALRRLAPPCQRYWRGAPTYRAGARTPHGFVGPMRSLLRGRRRRKALLPGGTGGTVGNSSTILWYW